MKLKQSRDAPAVTRESLKSHPRQLQDQNNRTANYYKQHTATETKIYFIKYDNILHRGNKKEQITTLNPKKTKTLDTKMKNEILGGIFMEK